MKNTLTDLNNHLFEMLEKLNDDDLKGDDLKEEISRSQAMGSVADMIIRNGELALKAHLKFEGTGVKKGVPAMLEVK